MVANVFVMAAKMDLSDGVEGKCVDVAVRIRLLVHGRDEDVVHIQQQAAAGATGDLAQEGHLVHLGLRKGQIAGGVFQQHRAS